MDKFILDACCSGRSFWFDKNHPNCIYIDNRTAEKGIIGNGYNPNFEVKPDMIMDNRNMSFKDKTFKLVVFDPPHIFDQKDTSLMKKKFGDLNSKTWKEDLTQGFNECWRVLDDYGVLIFKWSEARVSVRQVLDLFKEKALFGHKTSKQGKTIWICFMKIPKCQVEKESVK